MISMSDKGMDDMICRIWRGWTTKANAAAYETAVRTRVIPGIEERGIAGFRHIDLVRRISAEPDQVEFATIMWFDDLAAVIAFMGQDYERAHVPDHARHVLSRFDDRAAHYEVLERRAQSGKDASGGSAPS